MQRLEYLKSIVPEINIDYDHLMPNKLSGLFYNDTIILNAENNYYKNVSVLAEEIGHYYTSKGDITDYKKLDSARQELRARRYGIKLILPLEKLIECYEEGLWGDIYAMCLHLEIDNEFFEAAIEDYKSQFGTYVKYRGYRIGFEPLNIVKDGRYAD